MQRLFYPVLLFAASIIALVVCLKPSVGDRLLAQAEPWISGNPSAAGAAEQPPFDGYGTVPNPPSRPVAAVRPATWPSVAGSDPTPAPGTRATRGDEASERWVPCWKNAGWETGAAGPPIRRDAPRRWNHNARRVGAASEPRGYYQVTDRGRPADLGRSIDNAPRQASPENPRLARRSDLRTTRIPYTDRTEANFLHEERPAASATAAIPCKGAQIVARVDKYAILTSDVWIAAEQILMRNRAKVPSGLVVQQREALVKQSFRALLTKLVENKLVYSDLVRTLPPEGLEHAQTQLDRQFEETELPQLMELWGVQSRRELDQKLMSSGTSVQRHKRAFSEQVLASQWIREQIKVDEDVNHEQMLAYYRDHLADFEQPARARWEQLSVRVSRYPSKEAARAALGRMGNQVIDGRPFGEVARELSDGPTAAQGGLRKWTTRGSLVSEPLDRAIFGLPVGRLSPIIEDGNMLHVIRVVERQEARRTPFVEAQHTVRKKIREQRNRVQQEAYLDRLRRRVPVWTIYDNSPTKSATLGARN